MEWWVVPKPGTLQKITVEIWKCYQPSDRNCLHCNLQCKGYKISKNIITEVARCTLSRFICPLVAASPPFYSPQLLFDLSRFPLSPPPPLLSGGSMRVSDWTLPVAPQPSADARDSDDREAVTSYHSRTSSSPPPPRSTLFSKLAAFFVKTLIPSSKTVSTTTRENVIWRVMAPGPRLVSSSSQPRSPGSPLTLLH